jgi:hypothetical protein
VLQRAADRPGAGLLEQAAVVQNAHVVADIAERRAHLVGQLDRRHLLAGSGFLEDAYLQRVHGRLRELLPGEARHGAAW